MRFSCLSGDQGYRAYRQHGGPCNEWVIKVDGEPVSKCVTADVDKRTVLRDVTDAEGNSQLDATGRAVLRETLTGDVTVELRSKDTGECLHRWSSAGPS